MICRRLLLAGLPGAAALLPGCATPPERTAQSHGADDGGIGGTGLRAGLHAPDDGGIGGTGVFGSVLARPASGAWLEVNGLRVETSAATLFLQGAVPGVSGPPRIGEALTLEAARAPDGPHGTRLVARRASVFHPLVGPLLRAPDGTLAVLGTRVEVPAATPIHGLTGAVLNSGDLASGVAVAVSGLWRGATVLATHVQLLRPGSPAAAVRGLLRRHAGALVVGGTRLAGSAALPGQAVGRFVVAQGTPGAGGDSLDVSALDVPPLAVFSGRIAALSVEGFLAPNPDAPGFHLAGFGLPLDPDSGIRLWGDTRQVLLGRYAGAFLADTALPLPSAPDARARVLAGPAVEGAIRQWLGRT